MEFMTLEDQTGMYDATVFPNIYREYCHLLATNQAYVVTGLVEGTMPPSPSRSTPFGC